MMRYEKTTYVDDVSTTHDYEGTPEEIALLIKMTSENEKCTEENNVKSPKVDSGFSFQYSAITYEEEKAIENLIKGFVLSVKGLRNSGKLTNYIFSRDL